MTTATHAPTGHPISTNSTRKVFDAVRDNPGLARKDVIHLVDGKGVPRNSSTSLITQLVARGNIRVSNGLLYATQSVYTPLKRTTPTTRKRKPAVVEVSGPVAEPTPAVQINSAWDAETLLNNLSIKQARALYDELRTIFGG
jgi:hypothetical protein